ncbi:C3a anaphylatoxin chemotactic receptor-like isoform X1 [Oreochromis niloticus]|uniref:C3a anaphylatoxin chemotactic receptor-like n=2 Tax=Oreochromis niloticus TaxID=8128 RepID=A0A669BND3_ORENI|nr:C3a anaphylatoxin chemotactic receptor-like isoform X1 [Oreochromis niloticus]
MHLHFCLYPLRLKQLTSALTSVQHFRHTMFPNASLINYTLKPEDDQAATVGISSIVHTVTIVLLMLTVVLGITGNSMVIWVAGFKLKPTVTNVWLVNLAIADLIFCFTRIFSLTRLFLSGHWPFGPYLCKFNGFFKYTNMFCSVFLLAVISLDRVLCIWWPVFTRRRRTLWVARMVAVCIWIIAILFSIPYFIHRQIYVDTNNQTKCSVDPKEKAEGYNSTKVALYSIRFLCGFIFPFMVILICYILAAVGIRRTRLVAKSRPLRILACLVTAFFLCWAPYHCLQLVRMINVDNIVVKNWFYVAQSIAYFNSCVNPLLYFCMGLKLRNGFKNGLMGVYTRALTDDTGGQITQWTDQSLD